MYKPILYDEIAPNVAVYGASYARDAFDPDEIGKVLDKTVFNYGVSGGTVYETRRFIESSLHNPNLEAVIINLDTVFRDRDVRNKFAFDEGVLNVGPDGRPNRWMRLQRAYSLALTGWSTAYNIELFLAIWSRERGIERSRYLPPYERADLTAMGDWAEDARRQIFPQDGAGRHGSINETLTVFQAEAVDEFELMLDGLCEHGVDVHAYFTPNAVWSRGCEADLGTELAALDVLRRKQQSCPARITYFDFDYPNAVTLEGIWPGVTLSEYFRPDGHPRPTVGRLMITRMFDVALPDDAPAALEDDFGVDLLTHPDAEGWLRSRALRCTGDWGDD